MLGGDNGTTSSLDGFAGGGGGGQIDLESFFQFTGSDDFDAGFVNPFLANLQGFDDRLGVDSLVGFKFVEGVEGNDNGIAL